MGTVRLSELPEGRAGTVSGHVVERVTMQGVGSRQEMYERLSDLGFTKGAIVQCLYAAPFGDPRAYLVRGTIIALRREDAQMIDIRVHEKGEAWD